MNKKIGFKLLLCTILTFGLVIACKSNLKAEIGDSGVVLENGEEDVKTLLGGVKLHEQDLKFLKDCAGNYYYEYDTQYLETQPNAEGVKIVTWSYRNEGEWKMAGVSDIAANFEKENPGWIVVGGTNADFFNINGNGAMNSNAMEMGELIHSKNDTREEMWRGILGFTKDNKLIAGIPDMTDYFSIHVYENKEMKEELSSIKVSAINPSKVSDTGITVLTKDINQKWDLTGCKVVVGYYDICRYNNDMGQQYFVKGTLLEARDGKSDERPQAIDDNNKKINEFYLVSKDGSLDNLEMNTYVKIQKDYIGEYADVYNSASYYWKILDQGKVLFEGHSNSQKRQEYMAQYPNGDFSYITATKSRCLFGVREDGSYVMAVIGGSTSSGATLSEAAYYMKEIGCIDAWDFDGGGSATLVARDEMGYIQTINVPSDAGNGTERRVGNAILMVVRDPGFNCYKKNSTETSVMFTKKTDSTVFDNMENIKITVGDVTKEVAADEENVVFENLKPDTKYQALISYTYDGEEFTSQLEVETKKFNPGYKITPNSYGFTITRYMDNDVIRITSTLINVDGKVYNMGENTKFVIDDLYKDYQYTISYTYTAEIIATKETFTISVEEEKYDTLNYEIPTIVVFEENRKTDDKLRIKYEYNDPDELITEVYLSLNGKKTILQNNRGTYMYENLDFDLNNYYVKLVIIYTVNGFEEELESDVLTYEKPACIHEYDNECDTTCNLCNEEREVEDHKWIDATCEKAKHCEICNKEEGATLGHTEVVDEKVEPTCEEAGLTEGKHCLVCNKVLVEQQTIKALGHTEVKDAAKEATCEETGLTDGKHCSVCNKVLVEQETIEALGHTEVKDPAKEATCEETGLTEGKHCSVCDKVLVEQKEIKALGHKWVDATFDAPKTCGVCKKTEGQPLDSSIKNLIEDSIEIVKNTKTKTEKAENIKSETIVKLKAATSVNEINDILNNFNKNMELYNKKSNKCNSSTYILFNVSLISLGLLFLLRKKRFN